VKRLAILGLVGAAALAGAVVLNNRHGDDPPPPAPPTLDGAPERPRIDVVRANEAGDTVIAGRAPAHAEVTVLEGDTVLGTAVADERGDWVFVPQGALPEGTRQISLSAKLPDGRIVLSQGPMPVTIGKKG